MIVVPEAASEPCCTVELASHPFCAVLVCKDSMLVVGQDNEFLTFLSLEDPTYPVSLGNISLATKIYSIISISQDYIICG